jgi:enoyl-CoA hydratase
VAARIRTEAIERVLVITLDDVGHHNAYDGDGLKAIAAAGAQLDHDAALRVGVIRGAGGAAFCSGADIGALASGGFSDPPYPELAEGFSAKPMISAIEGICLGGGMMIATGTDLRIAGRSATFGLPEARWNYPAQWLGALARQVLPAHALELALLGDERLPASRLVEMGWLNRVVVDGTAFDQAMEWATRIAGLAPGALRRSKALIAAAAWDSPEAALALGHRHARELMGMTDTIEGASAFAEGRAPEFTDE